MATTQIHSGAQKNSGAQEGRGVQDSGQRNSSFLRRAVQIDAEIILFFGILLLIFAGPISAFMGVENPNILRIGGLFVLIYDGGRLLWATMSSPIDLRLAKLSLYGNALWVIVSVPVLALELLPLSNGGWWVMAGLADFAALFAVLQWYGLRKSR